jgi:N-dimethylarginine dimethylaminohydrolase
VTYLLSYPGPSWHIRGAFNFRSRLRAATDPRAALREWIAFADLLAERGERLAVLAPPAVSPPLTGLLYAANYGSIFWRGERPIFLLSHVSVPHREGERTHVRALVESLGIECLEAKYVWEGQADVCTLPGNRHLLTWGVRSLRESVDEVSALLPHGAAAMALRLREPFFHGDTCLNPVTTPEGRTVLLCHEGAFADATLAAVESFCAPDIEVLPVSEADALGYACNALSVGGDLIVPRGLSSELLGALRERAVDIVEIELSELFGKGGGGPRCLVNELRGFEASVPEFASWRPALEASAHGYPEVAGLA